MSPSPGSHNFVHRAPLAAFCAAIVMAAGCTAPPRLVGDLTSSLEVADAARQEQSGFVRLSDESVPAKRSSPALDRTARHDSVVPISYEVASSESDVSGVETAQFTPAEPRVPLDRSNLDQCYNPKLAACRYPDEYLCDGGDRDKPVHYDDFNRNGLDTQDTVAEYSDHTGDRHVTPANCVCVYAPRFGTVRSISQTETGFNFEKLAETFDTAGSAGLRNRAAPTYHQQNQGTDRVRMRSRAGGLENNAVQRAFGQATHLTVHEKLIGAFQDLTFVRSGRFDQTDEARLAYGIGAALVWTRDQSPLIAAQTDTAQEVYAWFRPLEYTGIEEKIKSKGRLRIVKLADKRTALPGDVVNFTIRYDNLGDRELHHIHIVDNLTPRLQYVEDSADSDRDGQLVVHDNEEGSLVLEFELFEPLPGHNGGVVTFQARVR